MRLLFLIVLISTITNAKELIVPIPLNNEGNLQKAKLGKMLFEDPLFSKDGSTSCLSCHNIYAGGADAKEVSLGFGGMQGDIHSPTVLNAVYNFRQFWNGRAANLKEQIDGPIHNPVEHNMDRALVEERLNSSDIYQKEFAKIYKTDTITYEDFVDALVSFEKMLTTPNAKFDRYLRAEVQLEPQELEGYKLFKQYGCITCHNGINIGGNSFQKMGTFKEYKTALSYPDRSHITKKASHKNVFKVPTLRNISLTAPYFHDASASTLEEAVEKMAIFNLGIKLSAEEIQKIVLFLNTLKGDSPAILEIR